MTSDEIRERWAVVALVFGLAVPVTYVAERLYEWLRGETGDPRMILRSLHTAYYWRVGVAVWWGVVVALVLTILLARRGNTADVRRVVSWAAVVLVPLLLVCTFVYP